eukprot:g8952.t1
MLVTSIMSTLKALFWALVLLGLVVYVFGVLFASAVNDHINDGNLPVLVGEADDAAKRYFGSLSLSMLSLFMSIAGGVSWEEVLVVTGVFCQSAIESASNDHAMVVQSMLDNKAAHLNKIKNLFSEFGTDGGEKINNPAVREYFEALGLDVWDAWSFFKLLDDDGGGSVEIEDEQVHRYY